MAYTTVKYGSYGSAVKTMQSYLIQLGWSMKPYGADGSFGSVTLAAVKGFQRSAGLTVDGICGPLTWAALVKAAGGSGSSGSTTSSAKARTTYTSSDEAPPATSSLDSARRTELLLTVNGVDVVKDVQERMISAIFTDMEDAGADEFEITLENPDGKLIDTWLTKEAENRAAANKSSGTKMTMTPTMVQENWDGNGKNLSLACGIFAVNEVDESGPPDEVTFKGSALEEDYKTVKRYAAWENITLYNVAKIIAKSGGYALMYLTEKTVKYSRKEQNNETDISFLQKLCTAASLKLKVTSGTLVVYDGAQYEKKTAVRTIAKGDGSYDKFSFAMRYAEKYYSSCHVKYETTDGTTYEYTYTPSGSTYDEDTCLEVTSQKVGSNAEAKEVAIAELKKANKGEKTAKFTNMPEDLTCVAGLTVTVSGFSGWNGTYAIEKGTHKVSRSGSKMTLELREVITSY
jgi:phage protein D